ncbi:hypothetical protein [Aeoliella sp. SH292]|uniref:hypothetical protein n=1 Tax=Aeoliella sp. SH292 TaxID=3454464 RepID=UPI003F9D26DC
MRLADFQKTLSSQQLTALLPLATHCEEFLSNAEELCAGGGTIKGWVSSCLADTHGLPMDRSLTVFDAAGIDPVAVQALEAIDNALPLSVACYVDGGIIPRRSK